MKIYILCLSALLISACAKDKTKVVTDHDIAGAVQGYRIDWTCQPKTVRQNKETIIATVYEKPVGGVRSEYIFSVKRVSVSIDKRGMGSGSWSFLKDVEVTTAMLTDDEIAYYEGSYLTNEENKKNAPIAVLNLKLKQLSFTLAPNQSYTIDCDNRR